MKPATHLTAAVLLVLLAACGEANSPKRIRLATTTSTEDSGLLPYLLEPLEKREGVKIDRIAVGTGQAPAIARRGDADLVLVHARSQEDAFVAEGWGVAISRSGPPPSSTRASSIRPIRDRCGSIRPALAPGGAQAARSASLSRPSRVTRSKGCQKSWKTSTPSANASRRERMRSRIGGRPSRAAPASSPTSPLTGSSTIPLSPSRTRADLRLLLHLDLRPEDGVVEDRDLAGARLRAVVEARPESLLLERTYAGPKETSTDAEGRFVLEGLSSDRLGFTAAADGLVSWRHTETLPSRSSEWTIVLHPGRPLLGRLLLAENEPAAGVSVLVRLGPVVVARERTDREGRFRTPPLDEHGDNTVVMDPKYDDFHGLGLSADPPRDAPDFGRTAFEGVRPGGDEIVFRFDGRGRRCRRHG